MRLCNVFDYDWYVEIPGSYSLVIGCCYKSAILIHKSDSVDGTQMLVVFLRDFSRVHVILRVGGRQPNKAGDREQRRALG